MFRPGKLKIGFYHPDHLRFGYQQVTGPLFDGRSERDRLVRLTVTEDGVALVLPSVEDLIADRLGQHAVASPADNSRLLQARVLFSLLETPDISYLRQRISDEQGDPALIGLDPTPSGK